MNIRLSRGQLNLLPNSPTLTAGQNRASRIDETDVESKIPNNLLSICWWQCWTELCLSLRGINFRTADPEKVRAAYAAMTVEEFDAVNGRQAWANWRTIAPALKNAPADKPLVCVDLACGTGMSTSVLAHYCPPGSSIIGYELSAVMIEMAKRRKYRHKGGAGVEVQFRRQSITERWMTPEEEPLPSGSVDVVNASGVVGHHFTPDTVQPLIVELTRVIAPKTGVAILDVGPKLSKDALQRQMGLAGFVPIGHFRSSWFDYGQVAFRLTDSVSAV